MLTTTVHLISIVVLFSSHVDIIIPDDISDQDFDDTYFQSINSENIHLFAQNNTKRRDIASFPTSTPLSMSPAICRYEYFEQSKGMYRKLPLTFILIDN